MGKTFNKKHSQIKKAYKYAIIKEKKTYKK